jgi:hypothetical protein
VSEREIMSLKESVGVMEGGKEEQTKQRPFIGVGGMTNH